MKKEVAGIVWERASVGFYETEYNGRYYALVKLTKTMDRVGWYLLDGEPVFMGYTLEYATINAAKTISA
jgi:hypothetical protein